VDEDQRLLAGRQCEDALAALVMIQVVELRAVVEQGTEAPRAVEEDRAFAQLTGFGFRERMLAIDADAQARRFVAA
jgi:hypothetical protein